MMMLKPLQMTRTFLFLLTMLLFGSGMQAQTGATITGTTEEGEAKPLPFATVMLRAAADSSLIKAGYSDENGAYEYVMIPAGTYFIESRFTGYANAFSEPFTVAEGATLNVPALRLSSAATDVEALTISAEKPIVVVKPDMTVFNVEGTINAVGENAFNLLRKAPGVIIDNNDNIMLLGKSGVRIYIDGKPSPLSGSDLANFLKSIQSDQIESFEIITNPSSKYDASGNAGIINVRFKRDKNMGTNATLNLDYSAWINHRLNGSGTVNYRGKKVSLYGSYGAGTGKTRNFMHFIREQVGIGYDQTTEMVNSYFNQNFRAGADFYVKPHHTIGVMASGFLSNGGMTSEALNTITDAVADTVTGLLQSNSSSDMDRSNYNFNLNYRFDNEKSTTLNVDLDYGTYDISTVAFQPNLYLNAETGAVTADRSFTSNAPTLIDIYTFKTDYQRPLLKGALGAGVKLAMVKTDNTFDFFNLINGEEVLDTSRSNQFQYTENVNAAYLNYNRQFKKWAFQAGVRAEQTNSVGNLVAQVSTGNERVERHYINLFPSGGVTWNPNQNNTLRLTYSRRIDRPNYETLNPFQMKLDELSYMAGNPFLKPQYTHNFEVAHTFKYTLNTSLSYSVTTDFFTEITDTVETVRTFLTTQNLSTQKVATFSVSYPFQVTKWWSTYTNASVFNVTNTADFGPGKEINISATSFNVFHQSTFELPKGIGVQFSGFYNSPGLWGANFRNSKFWGMEVGAVKKLFKERGVFKLGMSDILFTMQWRGVQNFGALYFDARGGWESRQIKASYSHTFGNTAIKNRKRKTGLEEESDRAGGGGGRGR